jgi:hypothetical protein
MLTVTQRLMSGLGQAGSDWAWSMSIHDINISPPQVTEASCASEEQESKTEDQDTHDASCASDHSSSSSALKDLYVSES